MQINRLVEQVLSERAIELLDIMAAHVAAVHPEDVTALASLRADPDTWNDSVLLLREIFEAEVQITGEHDWLGIRILQSWGVKDGSLVWQFTPVFGRAIAAR